MNETRDNFSIFSFQIKKMTGRIISLPEQILHNYILLNFYHAQYMRLLNWTRFLFPRKHKIWRWNWNITSTLGSLLQCLWVSNRRVIFQCNWSLLRRQDKKKLYRCKKISIVQRSSQGRKPHSHARQMQRERQKEGHQIMQQDINIILLQTKKICSKIPQFKSLTQ